MEKFRPERLLYSNGMNVSKKILLFFRQCEDNADWEWYVFVFVVCLLQKFSFQPDPSMENVNDFTKPNTGNALFPKTFSVKILIRD